MRRLRVGDGAERRRIFARADVDGYRSLSGDPGLQFGPGDPDAVPGPLVAGMISDLLGTTLPGPGTMWLKQTLRYPGTARIGGEVVAEIRVTRLRPDKGLVDLAATCRAGGEPVLEGDSLVLVPDLEDRYDR
jgi:acyl dehydratase